MAPNRQVYLIVIISYCNVILRQCNYLHYIFILQIYLVNCFSRVSVFLTQKELWLTGRMVQLLSVYNILCQYNEI